MSVEKVDFDQYAADYDRIMKEDLEFFGEENSYFAEYKIRVIMETFPGNPIKILDYGCGIGRNIPFYHKYFPQAQIYGCDISEKSLEIAKTDNPNAKFFLISEENIQKQFEEFDIVSISCVFHHIEPPLRKGTIENIHNLLRPKGSVYIFEHNPINPVTRKIVRDCVWDEDAILLPAKESEALIEHAGMKVERKRYTIFFPAFLKFMRPMEKLLGFIPLGGQYYIKANKS